MVSEKEIAITELTVQCLRSSWIELRFDRFQRGLTAEMLWFYYYAVSEHVARFFWIIIGGVYIASLFSADVIVEGNALWPMDQKSSIVTSLDLAFMFPLESLSAALQTAIA